MIIKTIVKTTLIAALLLPVYQGIAIANEEKRPTVEEMVEGKMDRSKKAIEQASDFLNTPASELRKRLQPNHINLKAAPMPSLPNIKIDMAQISKQLGLVNESLQNEVGTKIKVFISFSMSDGSLKKLFTQAHLLGRQNIHFSVIGMLGEENFNLMETVKKIRSITEGLDIDVRIDPDGFEKYQITQVPALVVYRNNPEEEAKCIAENDEERLKELQSFVGVYGDVSIEFALEHLAKTEPSWKQEIEELIEVVSPRLSSYSNKGAK